MNEQHLANFKDIHFDQTIKRSRKLERGVIRL